MLVDGRQQVTVRRDGNAQGQSEHLLQRGTNPIDCAGLVRLGSEGQVGASRVCGGAVGVTKHWVGGGSI